MAAGVALLFSAGCDLALDEEFDEDEEGLVDHADGIDIEGTLIDQGVEPTNAEGEGVLTAVCHFGPNMTQADSDDILVSESELPAHIGHGDVFGTCADFFCGAS